MKLMPPDFRGEGRPLSDYGLALGVQEGDDNGAQTAINRACRTVGAAIVAASGWRPLVADASHRDPAN